MTQPLVLAIEPDLRQAAILKRIVGDKALADLAVVESIDAAVAAMRTTMPDVLLLSALLSPRDEDELMTHLRTLDNADHLQTHTIPQLSSSLEVPGNRVSRGLLSAFRRKKEPAPINAGCDPDLFAEEIRVFIQRAAAKRRERAESGQAAPDMRAEARPKAGSAAIELEPAGAAPSSWSSPFEWKPTAATRAAQKSEEASAAAIAKPAPVPAPEATPVEMQAIAIEPVTPVEPRVEEEPALAVAAIVEPLPVLESRPVVADTIAFVEVVAEETPEPVIEVVAAPEAIVELPQIELVEPPLPVWTAPRAVAPIGEETEIAFEPVAKKTEAAVSEWAPPPPVGKTCERLGPLAGWARTEPSRKAKPEVVTSDDVRALISALAVPPAVASVTYARGCRIRRVRVPPAPEHDSESFGTVILSRRILTEQRERRPSA